MADAITREERAALIERVQTHLDASEYSRLSHSNAGALLRALTTSEAEVERLRESLTKIAERTSWIGVPVDTEAASYLGQELQAIVFEAAAALTGEKK